MKKVMMFAVVMGFAVSMAFGGGADLADVDASAKWVAHIDFGAIRNSEVGKSIMKGDDWASFETKMAALKVIVGVDPSKDLKTATLYGPDYSEKGNVAIVRGAFDTAKIKALIGLLKDYSEKQVGNSLVYTWTDEKKDKPVACAFYGEDTMTMGDSVEAVANAIAVLERRAPALSAKTSLRLPEAHEGAFISFGALEHDGRIGKRRDGAMGDQIDWISFGVGEDLGKVGINLSVGAKTVESALQIEQVLAGLKALTLLSEEVDKQTRDILMGATVTRSEKEVKISIKGDVETIVTGKG